MAWLREKGDMFAWIQPTIASTTDEHEQRTFAIIQ